MREPTLEGFDELFRREYQSIARAAFLVTGDRATAAEVTQDAFTQAVVHWRKVRRYEKPGAWVRRVAIRQAVKVRRRDRRRTELMRDAALDDRMSDPASGSPRLAAALAGLSPKQRAMVVLHYYECLPVNEAAEVLGCRPATASVHLHRARSRLADELGERDGARLAEVIADV